jgi:hypothetical protein
MIRVLTRRGYRYDASTLPTFLGPVARAYYFMTARLSPEERRRRRALFGTLREGLRPNRPFRWALEERELVEIPVTTMPGTRLPIHASYLIYLSRLSPALARAYLGTALRLCRFMGGQPSLLLHSLDFLGRDDLRELSFFPGMDLTSERRLAVVADAVRQLTAHYRVMTLEEHARQATQGARLPLVRVHPDTPGGPQ